MKTLMLAAAAAFTLAAGAVDRLGPTSTEADYRAVFAEIMATNAHNAVALRKNFWSINIRKDLDSLRREFDGAIAVSGWRPGAVVPLLVTWPRSSAASRESLGWDARFPVRLAVATRQNRNATYPSLMGASDTTYEECIAMLAEMSGSPTSLSFTEIDAVKKGIRDRAAKVIKRKMREQGISFVVKDGVNPVAQRLEVLAAALNAPRFAGLNEWNASLGIQAEQVNVLPGITGTEVAKLKDDIYYGEKAMTPLDKTILYLCLGVDAYNQFVKEFNGDK